MCVIGDGAMPLGLNTFHSGYSRDCKRNGDDEWRKCSLLGAKAGSYRILHTHPHTKNICIKTYVYIHTIYKHIYHIAELFILLPSQQKILIENFSSLIRLFEFL